MDGPSLGALIAIGALIALLFLVAPVAYRHDRSRRRRGCADSGPVIASSGVFFGGDGGGCSDGGASC